jgi:dTDP-4-dehydrorhamnose 3,5-epimerase
MKIINSDLQEVLIMEPNIFKDERGIFFESFNERVFEEAVGQKINFVQDNHSFSKKNTLRGIHYQKKPWEQGKLVRVIEGVVFDVAVDLRKNSPSFGNWVGVYLSGENNKQLWIPEGFGHAFYVTSKYAHFLYKTTSYFQQSSEQSIVWNDENIAINWPIKSNPNLSVKDKNAKSFKDFIKSL